MQRMKQAVIGIAILSLTLPASAQLPSAYPAKGQSASKQKKDDSACQDWARKQAGDPAAAQAQSGATGERARGAARGAVGGAVVGGIAGDAGKGAAIGAAGGTMVGGKRKRDKEAAAQANAQQGYANAYGACMSGRGYTVK